MSAVDIEDFLTKVLPLAPGVPEPTAVEHIRNAAVEFCEATKLWRFEDSFDIGDEPNVLCCPQDSVIHKIERADWNGRKLEKAAIGWLDDTYPDWRSTTDLWKGEPKWYTQMALDTIRPVPYPNTDPVGTLDVSLILLPSQDAETLPQFLYDHYRTLLGWGAAGSLLMLPGQNFTNNELGVFYQAKFDDSLGRKSKIQQSGQQKAPIRTKATFY